MSFLLYQLLCGIKVLSLSLSLSFLIHSLYRAHDNFFELYCQSVSICLNLTCHSQILSGHNLNKVIMDFENSVIAKTPNVEASLLMHF